MSFGTLLRTPPGKLGAREGNWGRLFNPARLTRSPRSTLRISHNPGSPRTVLRNSSAPLDNRGEPFCRVRLAAGKDLSAVPTYKADQRHKASEQESGDSGGSHLVGAEQKGEEAESDGIDDESLPLRRLQLPPAKPVHPSYVDATVLILSSGRGRLGRMPRMCRSNASARLC